MSCMRLSGDRNLNYLIRTMERPSSLKIERHLLLMTMPKDLTQQKTAEQLKLLELMESVAIINATGGCKSVFSSLIQELAP